ncbi:MAG: GTPase [Phycisphaerales bacterium]
MSAARWSLQSPGGVGAVAVIALTAPDTAALDHALEILGIGTLREGQIAVRNLLGVDHGVVMRWGATFAALTPHGGGAVVRALCEAIEAKGISRAAQLRPREQYPEATDEIEAAMLAALSRAPSPLAVDLLLDQPARWRSAGAQSDPERDRVLRRLIDPPLVVALGASNIGKSTLANALAGRHVSLVADEPGTTRDHVGVMLDLAGLVVRYVDTPGVRADAPQVEADAAQIARDVLARADLVLRCCDPGSALVNSGNLRSLALTVGLRRDLAAPASPVEVEVSVRHPESIGRLVGAIRERLLPASVLAHPGPWRFWDQGEVEGFRP